MEWMLFLFIPAFIAQTYFIIQDIVYGVKQSKWYRKRKGGKWFYMAHGLPMAPYWTQKPTFICQGRILKTEEY